MKIQTKKNWIPIKEFFEKTDIKAREIYARISSRQWYDGYVIKKSPTGRIVLGCVEDYHEWLGI